MVEAWQRTRAVKLAGLGTEAARLKAGFVVNYQTRIWNEQRVHKVMVILDSDSVHVHRGTPITRVYFDVF